MRVLHLAAGNLYGGVEAVLITLARHAYPEMESRFALCFDGIAADMLRRTGSRVDLLGVTRISRPHTVIRARANLRALLSSESFDVVICHSAWALALFARTVKSMSIHLVMWVHEPLTGRPWLERWACLKQPDLAICNSNFTRSSVESVLPRVRAEVVYCPVEDGESPTPADARMEVRRENSTRHDATVIVQVSRMERLKGQLRLLDALAGLRTTPGWVCWIVGGPQRPKEAAYFEELKARASDLGLTDRIGFLGQRRDVIRLLKAADIYCQPNIGPEGFGLTFVDAMYAGLPVITTAMGGAAEVIDDSCGVMVPPDDLEALQKAIARLIENPAERMRLGKNGPGRARRLSDPKLIVTRTSRLLHAL